MFGHRRNARSSAKFDQTHFLANWKQQHQRYDHKNTFLTFRAKSSEFEMYVVMCHGCFCVEVYGAVLGLLRHARSSAKLDCSDFDGLIHKHIVGYVHAFECVVLSPQLIGQQYWSKVYAR